MVRVEIIVILSSGHAGGTSPGQTLKKPKDLSVREREERECGEGGGLYDVYMCDSSRERGGWVRVQKPYLCVIHT